MVVVELVVEVLVGFRLLHIHTHIQLVGFDYFEYFAEEVVVLVLEAYLLPPHIQII